MKMNESNHGSRRVRKVLAAREDAEILGVRVDVYVLDGEVRVISSRAMERVLGGASDHGNFGRFLARIAGVSSASSVRPIFEFTPPWGGRSVHGVEVTVLADAAAAITDMKIAGTLHASREHLVRRARQIERALSKVALVALVDEATGYQSTRAPDALAQKLVAYLLPGPADWQRVFPVDFFRLMARLYRVQLENDTERPVFFSAFIARYVYDAIDPEVARELRERNPSPQHGRNHHQLLTPRAKGLLVSHLGRVASVMRQSASPAEFRRRFDTEFRGAPLQLSF